MNTRKILQFAIGPVAAAILGVFSVPVIAWFFSQEDIGRLTMLQVFLGFSVMLFSLGLDQCYVREFHEEENKSLLLKLAVLPGLLLLVIVISILIFADNVISFWLFGIKDIELSILVGVAVLFQFISRFLSLILRMNERGVAYSMSQLLPKLTFIFMISFYVLFGFSKDINNLAMAYVCSVIVTCVIYAWNTRKDWCNAINLGFDLVKLKRMLQFGVPLIFGGLAFWGLTAADKVVLRSISSFEELAIYSVSVSFASAGIVLQTIFSTVWAPTVYKWASTGHRLDDVNKVTRFMTFIVVLCFSLVGLMSWMVDYLLPASYTSVQWIVVACIGYPLLYMLSETTAVGIGISRRSGLSMTASLMAFLCNLVGNYMLIPHFGAAGAAVSTCISFFIFLVLRTELAIYSWRPIPRVQLYIFSALMVFGAVNSAINGVSYPEIVRIYWCSMLFISIFFFKSEVNSIYAWLIHKVKSK